MLELVISYYAVVIIVSASPMKSSRAGDPRRIWVRLSRLTMGQVHLHGSKAQQASDPRRRLVTRHERILTTYYLWHLLHRHGDGRCLGLHVWNSTQLTAIKVCTVLSKLMRCGGPQMHLDLERNSVNVQALVGIIDSLMLLAELAIWTSCRPNGLLDDGRKRSSMSMRSRACASTIPLTRLPALMCTDSLIETTGAAMLIETIHLPCLAMKCQE
jgi:hypothetical protein